jgi:hypothetical protein
VTDPIEASVTGEWRFVEPATPGFFWCRSSMGVECAELRDVAPTVEGPGGATWYYPRSRHAWIVPPDAMWWSVAADVPELGQL